MLNGFENETAPLTDYERNALLPVIICGLQSKFGKESAVKNGYIVKALRAQGYELTEARVRKIINHIRVNGLVIGLIATSEGYYIAKTRKELSDYVNSLRGREEAIRVVRISMERQMEMFK